MRGNVFGAAKVGSALPADRGRTATADSPKTIMREEAVESFSFRGRPLPNTRALIPIKHRLKQPSQCLLLRVPLGRRIIALPNDWIRLLQIPLPNPPRHHTLILLHENQESLVDLQILRSKDNIVDRANLLNSTRRQIKALQRRRYFNPSRASALSTIFLDNPSGAFHSRPR
jgi:hypothetical protein